MNTKSTFIFEQSTDCSNKKNVTLRKDFTAIKRQIYVNISVFMSSTCFGMTMGFTGTLFPQIEHVIDRATAPWLAGTIVLIMPFGFVFSSLFMRYNGRKLCQTFLNLFWILGWPCISFLSLNIWTLLIGFLLLGFAAGMNSSVCTIYVTETCEPRLRGLFMGILSATVAIGILFSHVIGILFSWRMAIGLSTLVPTIAFVLSIFSVESPVWLIFKGKTKKAEEIFHWLRNNAPESESELTTLLNKRTENVNQYHRSILKNISSLKFLKQFVTVAIMFTVQQGSGVNIIAFYAVQILQNMSYNLNVYTCTIIIDVLRLIATITACFVIKAFNRRTLYFSSSFCTILGLISIVVITKYNLSTIALIISLNFYIISLHMGVVQLAWALNAEIYPTVIRDVGSGMSGIFGCFITFGIITISPLMIDKLGIPLTFSMYAVIVFVGSIILYFIMPETNNITLQQIEDKIMNEAHTNLINCELKMKEFS